MDRKEEVRKYKEMSPLGGVYQVSHSPSGRSLLGASPNPQAMLNRIKAQLSMGTHPNKPLQADWDSDGKEAFEFRIVDLLPAPDEPAGDITEDLKVLHELWQDKIQIAAESSY